MGEWGLYWQVLVRIDVVFKLFRVPIPVSAAWYTYSGVHSIWLLPVSRAAKRPSTYSSGCSAGQSGRTDENRSVTGTREGHEIFLSPALFFHILAIAHPEVIHTL
jgi:hypothetical protein